MAFYRKEKVNEMRYYILLAIMCLAMIYVTVNSFGSASNASVDSAFTAAKENPVVPAADIFIEPAQSREVLKTPNGLDLTIEKITNFRDEKQDVIIETSLDDKTFYFDVAIAPNMTWGYGRVANFLIVPQKDAVVTSATSYYAEGDELVVVLDGNTTELYMYVGQKGSPKLVITNTDTFWSYDIRSNFVRITASSGNVSTVIMFWTDLDREVSFIEDSRKKENLRYSIISLNEHIVQLQSDLEREGANVANLSKELDKSNEELEKARLEKLQTEKFATDLKLSIEKGENLVTTSVLLSPLQSAVGIVIILILIVLAADAFLFKPRRRQI